MGAISCSSCGTALREGARFCDECGAKTEIAASRAEYKQVTVLFADVVHSMDIAAAVGPERLREIMADLVNCATAVVERYGGTVDKFTGDGIMALFGAPKALEDHAARACRAALELQAEVSRLAGELAAVDGIHLALRIGLNSGQVIAGEVGGARLGYTAIGEQVGMAQRMESAAAPGGVVLSESTAKLVADNAHLSEPKSLVVKGFDEGVIGHELLGMSAPLRHGPRRVTKLIGREWELAALTAMLDQAAEGMGRVAALVGPPGIGKSRLAAEVSAAAQARGFDVHWAVCESHTGEIPFHVVTDLLRAGSDVSGLDDSAARALIRERNPDADPEDLLLLDDLIGIADPSVPLPDIDPDARRRRVTALVGGALLARDIPGVFIVEDVHWIDQVSESMLADFVAVIPQSRALVLFTYRPEYQGILAWYSGGQRIALSLLAGASSSALTKELVGLDPSVAGLVPVITARAQGNPLFTEEIVRDFAEQGVLTGKRGAYRCVDEIREINVPATLQATISARIDRLSAVAKRCLGAAAVIGMRFDAELLGRLGVRPALEELIAAELIEPILLARGTHFAFRHPMIRTVAYESQLRSDRAEIHRKLADALESDESEADENAALIAEHREAAGDRAGAYEWHIKAATWSVSRDIRAAQTSWRRAREVADRLPGDEPAVLAKRIAPRASLCAYSWRTDATITDTGLEDLRELCEKSGDRVSLATGMAGAVTAAIFDRRYRDAVRLGSEHITLLESISDPTVSIGLAVAPANALWQAGDVTTALRFIDKAVDRARGNPNVGSAMVMGLPLATSLALRGACRFSLGLPCFAEDFNDAAALAREADMPSYLAVLLWKHFGVLNGAVSLGADDLAEATELLDTAQRSGDDFGLNSARAALALALAHGEGGELPEQVEAQLWTIREQFQTQSYANHIWLPRCDQLIAKVKAGRGDYDGAIDMMQSVLDDDLSAGLKTMAGPATTVLVESLLNRGGLGDRERAESAIARLAREPIDPKCVLYELPLLRMRALVAEARGNHASYVEYRDRYREMAQRVDFKPHIAMAEAMP